MALTRGIVTLESLVTRVSEKGDSCLRAKSVYTFPFKIVICFCIGKSREKASLPTIRARYTVSQSWHVKRSGLSPITF